MHHVPRVFDAIDRDIGSAKDTLDLLRQRDDDFLGINRAHSTGHDCAAVIHGHIAVERIVLQLLYAERDPLTIRVDRQDHRGDLVAL